MPIWGPAAAAAAKKIAASPASRKIAQQAAAVVAQRVSKDGASRFGSAQAARKQRALAESLARQVHGQLSRAVFIGSTDEHWVVWKDQLPLAAFPPVDGDVAAKPELAHVPMQIALSHLPPKLTQTRPSCAAGCQRLLVASSPGSSRGRSPSTRGKQRRSASDSVQDGHSGAVAPRVVLGVVRVTLAAAAQMRGWEHGPDARISRKPAAPRRRPDHRSPATRPLPSESAGPLPARGRLGSRSAYGSRDHVHCASAPCGRALPANGQPCRVSSDRRLDVMRHEVHADRARTATVTHAPSVLT